MRFVNLTPHELTVAGLIIPASGQVARVSVTQELVQILEIEDRPVPVVSQSYGEIAGLPDAQPGICYLVSNVVRSVLGSERPDVLAPDTGPSGIRQDGHIVGVTQLIGAATRGTRSSS
jgi:hypothetical protein